MSSSHADGSGEPRATAGLEGLSRDEAARRLAETGPNLLPAPTEPSVLRRTIGQLANAFTLLLLLAATLSILVLREPVEGGAILAIVVVNTAISVVQGERASGALRALRELTSPTARVVRGGQLLQIPAADLVPGDIVQLEAGDRVPADIELLETAAFAVDESNLTGESLPVEKDAGTRALEGAPLAERPSEAFASTLAVRGHAVGAVRRTGPATAVGTLASQLGERPEAPLEQEVREASIKIAGVAIALGILIALIAWSRGGRDDLPDGIFAGVALAVAAVPEGLLTVVTTALALGAHRMARRGAIVRRLSAIEALGATSVLCFDKTGTLTEGALSVAASRPLPGAEKAFWEAALRCNNVSDEEGDPIDVALVREATRLGHASPAGERISEQPFDTATRSMATVHEVAGYGPILSVKGAPEAVLERCRPSEIRDELERESQALAREGLRVLAIASAPTDDLEAAGLEALGLVAFRDPLRTSARPAVEQLRLAGIHLVMVTGDHPETARAIAREAGMADSPSVSGAELAALPAEERHERLANARVVARVEPGVKVDLVEAHRRAGHVVAMTGDGVN
ncbi:MAG: cation-transporting P-type ATPase, partial [Dehalococcoidia bacterium]